MSFALFGNAVSPGIAIGRAHLVSHATLEVAQYPLRERDIPRELARLNNAFAVVGAELEALRTEANQPGTPNEVGAFVDVHAMILTDPLLAAAAAELIRERKCNAEWALVTQMEILVEQFGEIEDAYLRERKSDVVQVVERVLKVLMDKPRKMTRRSSSEDLIVVAHDLSPADTIQFKNLKIGGFVTDLGGATSHTTIVARSLAIPAVVGMHRMRQLIQDDDMLIVDGTRGILIVDPDARVLEEFRLRKNELENERNKLKRLKSAHSATLDDVEISLEANIELPQDIDQVRAVDAAGVGLFRTEFLFMNRDGIPGEDEQFEAYRAVTRAMNGKPVTIRTLDIGADKTAGALERGERSEPNPALGLRAIRYCLAEPQLFLAQLRAMLRASHYGRMRILLPMLSHVSEVDQALAMIETAKRQLRDARIKFDNDIQVGGMIEIPAAAIAIGSFARRLDFLSIGTNDLIQYTLAVDRTDEEVSSLYDPLHPAVLRLIAQTIRVCVGAGRPVAVCGEMAGDARMTRILLGMGLRQFSMHPAQLLEVKQRLLTSDTRLLVQQIARLLRQDEPERILEIVEKINA
ncbi:Phosphoenolpyruvate-protein phosphotransferase [Georgfuchsia toluolica]|uniref:Phosphoenolpyruvate-protein phosphotransferase n=1 Tax=Georgfuchsia toluolica TaxID=424218 RepID=A0A916N1F6_9PROT|nr:phosphoenolpyruvate--protein phosphotransferase [Georgfuchsia toluolica]CAG4884875.1 Phosphoenolpyruvate-protein phosphotransferase [Georgfuchsia toluolica]